MFTGIIEEIGQLKSMTKSQDGARLLIAAQEVMEDTKVGDSIAVNGACLTVTTLGSGHFTADAMSETLTRTTLGSLTGRENVNLERALTLTKRLGGHLVSGHIDGTGEVLRREKSGIAQVLTIAAPPELLGQMIAKGSIAIDGISLTIISLSPTAFTVGIIPHTSGQTTLGRAGPGTAVNLETDIIGKYVARCLAVGIGAASAPRAGTLDLDFLAKNGFMT
jgi:riboflavin synthase